MKTSIQSCVEQSHDWLTKCIPPGGLGWGLDAPHGCNNPPSGIALPTAHISYPNKEGVSTGSVSTLLCGFVGQQHQIRVTKVT